MSKSFLYLIFAIIVFSTSCRTRNNEFVTIALSEKFSSFDTLTSTASDAAAERVRNLMFNSLVKKNENFEYVGELAKEINVSQEGRVVTFILQDAVRFHNGKEFTSADVKYTFDELFKSNGFKAGAFADTINDKRVPHIVSIDTPDPKTVVFTLSQYGRKIYDIKTNRAYPNSRADRLVCSGDRRQPPDLG